MTLNRRTDYGDHAAGQANKKLALQKASDFVQELQAELAPLLQSCEYYESDIRLGGAPAVALPNGKRAIAPDLRCITQKGNIFWVEVKDKCQRFYKPDTGADLFQVWGWYKVWADLQQPVLVVFRDAPLEACLPRDKAQQSLIDTFTLRWKQFGGQPYGAWLNQLLIPHGGYPQIFSERTRNRPMYILYFRMMQMLAGLNWQRLINAVDFGSTGPIQAEFRAFYEGKLLHESQVRELLKELFLQNNPPREPKP